MLHSSAQTEKSEIQKALEEQSWEKLIGILKADYYRNKFNLSEVESLTTNLEVVKRVKQVAQLYLMAHAPLDTLKMLYSQIDFLFNDTDGTSAALVAAANGRDDVLAWLDANKKLELDADNYNGDGIVLHAIANGQLVTLEKLLKPKHEGGYGLSLNVGNRRGVGPVLMAVKTRQLAMLRKLLQPISDGGYGWQPEIESCLDYAWPDKNVFAFLVLYYFNKLVEAGLSAALTWVDAVRTKFKAQTQLEQPLTERYTALLDYYISLPELPADYKLLISKLEKVSRGAARIQLADTYLDEKNVVAAYENYISVFTDSTCLEAWCTHAGYQLANMIFTGAVILKDNGQFDAVKTESQKNIIVAQRDAEGKNPDIMRQRALYAYEYLHGDSSVEASQLRKRFDLALSGETELITQIAIWPLEVTCRYFNYYRHKNSKLLTEESFNQSFRQMYALASTQKAARAEEIKSSASGSAFFAVQTKEIEKSPAKATDIETKEASKSGCHL